MSLYINTTFSTRAEIDQESPIINYAEARVNLNQCNYVKEQGYTCCKCRDWYPGTQVGHTQSLPKVVFATTIALNCTMHPRIGPINLSLSRFDRRKIGRYCAVVLESISATNLR